VILKSQVYFILITIRKSIEKTKNELYNLIIAYIFTRLKIYTENIRKYIVFFEKIKGGFYEIRRKIVFWSTTWAGHALFYRDVGKI